jgi:hypothetical protein
MDYEITTNKLRKLSLEFRTIASRLLRTDFREGMDNLNRFIAFIDSDPLIYDYIQQNQTKTFDIEFIIAGLGYHDIYPIPSSKQDEIAFTYQLLNYGLEQMNDYFQLCQRYGFGTKIQDHVDSFNKSVVAPFVQHINSYIEGLMIDVGIEEHKSISIQVTGGTIGQMNFADDNSSIVATSYLNQSEISNFNHNIEIFMSALDKEEFQSKEEIKDIVTASQEEVNSGKPKKGLLLSYLESLRNFVSTMKDGTELVKTGMEIIGFLSLIIHNLR